jgi:plasmid stabilization system protein ParE
LKVIWARPAAEMLRALRASDQEEIAYRVRLISEFPEMYPVRSHQPYAGFRYFFAKDWCVSYTMADDAIIILAIFHARRG